jgi:hypothetical protein
VADERATQRLDWLLRQAVLRHRRLRDEDVLSHSVLLDAAGSEVAHFREVDVSTFRRRSRKVARFLDRVDPFNSYFRDPFGGWTHRELRDLDGTLLLRISQKDGYGMASKIVVSECDESEMGRIKWPWTSTGAATLVDVYGAQIGSITAPILGEQHAFPWGSHMIVRNGAGADVARYDLDHSPTLTLLGPAGRSLGALAIATLLTGRMNPA